MNYSIYTDKLTQFKCRIQLEGASLRESGARVVIRTPTRSCLCDGVIEKDGMCTIIINEMRGIFDVGDTGEIQLEVIADGNYFQPWSSKFIVESSKKLHVEVFTNTTIDKPRIKIDIESPHKQLIESVVRELKNAGITHKNIRDKHKLVINIIRDCSNNYGGDNPAHILPTVIKRIVNA